MCLIGIAYQHLPGTPLLLLANRDEYYARPARAIDRWEDAPHILGGRDGQAGGSWLAVSESGRVAAVTNVRTGSRTPGRRSRGELVQAWLQDSHPAGFAHRQPAAAGLSIAPAQNMRGVFPAVDGPRRPRVIFIAVGQQ
jgi:uncharacterized protein with NRDE domain